MNTEEDPLNKKQDILKRKQNKTKDVVVCWLLNVPATCECISWDGSAQTILRAATLRQKL